MWDDSDDELLERYKSPTPPRSPSPFDLHLYENPEYEGPGYKTPRQGSPIMEIIIGGAQEDEKEDVEALMLGNAHREPQPEPPIIKPKIPNPENGDEDVLTRSIPISDVKKALASFGDLTPQIEKALEAVGLFGPRVQAPQKHRRFSGFSSASLASTGASSSSESSGNRRKRSAVEYLNDLEASEDSDDQENPYDRDYRIRKRQVKKRRPQPKTSIVVPQKPLYPSKELQDLMENRVNTSHLYDKANRHKYGALYCLWNKQGAVGFPQQVKAVPNCFFLWVSATCPPKNLRTTLWNAIVEKGDDAVWKQYWKELKLEHDYQIEIGAICVKK